MCNYLGTKYLELSDPHFHEPNQKSFRFLYFIFTRNLETFHKTHKKILTQFEEPIKVRLKKQQQTFVEQNLKKIWEENMHKLVKQNLERNSNAEAIMNTYHLHYDQQKSQESKIIDLDQESIGPIEKPDKRLPLTDKKIRSKTLANHMTPQQQVKNKDLNGTNLESRRNIPYLDSIQAFSQRSEKKIMLYKRNYTKLKNRQKNYSFHSETIQNANERLENQSACRIYDEQKTSRYFNQTVSKENSQRNSLNETFRPFCGLNTKDIFVKKPSHIITNPQQKSPIQDLKINFAARALIRSRVPVKKANHQQFSTTFYENSKIQPSKDEKQMKLRMKQNILKISSDLAIKTIQPQGYRGKSRIRYRSLNEVK